MTVDHGYQFHCTGTPYGCMYLNGDLERADPDLIAVVEELGNGANGQFANLKIIDIPNDVEWEIEEYDGVEWIAEKHRIWD